MACRSRSRRRSHKRRKKTCKRTCRGGKVTRNPFFNFLREFRKKHCGWNAVKVAVAGAKVWCRLDECKKQKFRKLACGAPKMKRRNRCGKRGGRRRGRSRSRRRSCRRRRRRHRSRRSSCGRKRRRRSRSRRKKRSCRN